MIALVTLGTVLGYLTRNTVAAAAPTLMEELHISTQQYSYIIAAYSAAYTVMQPVAGYVLDVLGTKVGYAMFAVLWAVFCGATALAGSWGGLALAREDVNYEVTSPYLTNDIVIVTLAQGGPKSLRGLKDGTLAMTVEQKYMDALASNEKLMERLGQIKRVSGGTQSLFDQLNSGAVNAIIVYSLALNYTG